MVHPIIYRILSDKNGNISTNENSILLSFISFFFIGKKKRDKDRHFFAFAKLLLPQQHQTFVTYSWADLTDELLFTSLQDI